MLNNPLNFFVTPESNKILKILIIVALVLFVATILVFWFGGSSFTESGVVIKLEGPQQALSGDEVTYKLTYENNTRTPLREMKFRFLYPEHAIAIKADGTYSSETLEEFEVEELAAGESGQREFKAFLVGDKGSILYAKVDLIYHAGNLSSRFEKKPVTVGTTIVGLPVPITLSAPPTAVSGQDITYTLDYRNESQGDIPNLRFVFTYPDGFTPKRTSPAPTTGTTWDLPLVKKGAGARITITGSISGNERDSKTIAVLLKRKIDESYIDYERAEASTIISSPLMSTSVSVNGSRDYTASPGDTLAYSITYRNTSSYTFNGLSLLATLDGEMFDLSTLEAGSGFFESSTNTIVWTAGAISDFSSLEPGRSGKVDFRIKLKPGFSGGLGAKNFFVKTSATLTTSEIPTGLEGDEISTQDSLITKISTQPTVQARMYYHDPAFGSVGPMPPKVGEETAFTIHWQVANPGNAMKNVVLKATLPSGVTWKNVVSSGVSQSQPMYDRTKSQVIWTIGDLPGGVGVSSPKYEASFQVSITPSTTQRNGTPFIIRSGTFTGTDSFTSENVVLNMDDLSTSDTVDRSGDGTVQ